MSPNSATVNSERRPENAEVRMWFAVYVTSRHEKKVQAQLALQNIETFLPLYTTVHCWKNRCRKVLQLPLLPNYLFVHIALSTRFAVLRTPGVTSLVCSGHLPAPLPSAAIEAIRAALAVREVEPHPYLAVGNRVRIIDAPLVGMEGILVRKKNKLRVVLLLDEIRQSAAVEVNADEDSHDSNRSRTSIVTVAFSTRATTRTVLARNLCNGAFVLASHRTARAILRERARFQIRKDPTDIPLRSVGTRHQDHASGAFAF